MSTDIRHLPAPTEGSRVETGPTQFGDDWPGIFIRGDNACYLAMNLRTAADAIDEGLGDVVNAMMIRSAADMLGSCNVHTMTMEQPEQGRSDTERLDWIEQNIIAVTSKVSGDVVLTTVITRETIDAAMDAEGAGDE